MRGTIRKRTISAVSAAVILWFALLPAGIVTYATEQSNQPLVTTRTGLMEAISAAASGDTIYVGDIEFHDYPPGAGVLNSMKRVTVSKSLIIKSGKPDGSKAVLSGGSFVLSGPTQESQKITCSFENILFDGGIDGDALVMEDWDCIDGEPEPAKAQYAATFKGNVDVTFAGCGFTRYMHDYGGALWGEYDNYDYTQPGDFLYDYRDNKLCTLNLFLRDCSFTENTAYYAGGAVYLEGREENTNVFLTAENCTFTNNNTSVGFHENSDTGYKGYSGDGGGAVFTRRTGVTLYGCEITDNLGNRVYGSAGGDGTRGGGLTCHAGTLRMTSCIISGNTASLGGGMYLMNTPAEIDGCIISKNSASTEAVIYMEDLDWGDGTGDPVTVVTDIVMTGLQANVGYAGGVYIDLNAPTGVTFINTAITDNQAQYAYGGFHTYYIEGMDTLFGEGSVDFIFCTYANNTCDYTYDREGKTAWFDYPGDIWAIPFVSTFGCVIADDTFTKEYPRSQTPDADNGYTCFAPPAQAVSAGVLRDSVSRPVCEIPLATVKEVYDGRFKNSVGRFYAGRNYNPAVTLRLDAAGGKGVEKEFTYAYGSAVLPEPARSRYLFDGWYTKDGTPFASTEFLFGTDVETFDLYAKWTADPNAKGLPPWSVALIALGGILILAVGVFFVLRQRKLALAQANGSGSNGISRACFEDLVRSYNLTARETEITALLVEGKTQKAVAEKLFISAETVKSHVKNIYEKLGVKSKYELISKFKK